MDHFEKQAAEWLEWVVERAQKGCAWCKHPTKPVYRKGLCRHCYEIDREIAKLQKKVDAVKAKHGGFPLAPRFISLEMDYKTALQMKKSAQVEGAQYLRYYSSEVTPLELEMEFRRLSKRFLHTDLFNHDAYLFEKFSPVHRRYVMYVISRLTREHHRRYRRRMAGGVVLREDIEESNTKYSSRRKRT